MRSLLPAAVSSCLLLLAGASLAPACYNDIEVGNAEREFKSSYDAVPNPVEKPSPEPAPAEDRGRELLVGGLGAVLLLGAAVVTFRK